MHTVFRRQHPAVSVQSRIFWQQRWMNVQQTTIKILDKFIIKNSHEPGQHDQTGIVITDKLQKPAVKILPGRKIGALRHGGRDACVFCSPQTGRMRIVADHGKNFAVDFLIGYGVDDRLQIAALVGNQYHQRQRSAWQRVHRKRTSPSPFSMIPRRNARSPSEPRDARAAASFSAARQITMPTPQLNVLSISRSSIPP